MFLALGLPPLGTQGYRLLGVFAHEHPVQCIIGMFVMYVGIPVVAGILIPYFEKRRASHRAT